MSTCNVQDLLTEGKCFSNACLTPGQQRIALLQLLCNIASAAGGGGVTSILAGAGISVDQATGDVTVTNAGVTSIIAGSGISIDVATGAVTITADAGGGASATDQWLLANLAGVQFTATTFDSDNVPTTATLLWPDGSAGVFTLTTKNATWLAPDAWTITHTASGKTITQAAVTRNSGGFVTVDPALTIA